MNPLRLALAALLIPTLGGCAMHARHHEGPAGPGQRMGAMDMDAQCDMHRKMMAGKSPAEQRTMMEERMRSMSPEMRQQMQEMAQRCR